MSTGSQRLLERKRVKVLELFNRGYSYRDIAKLVHLSLRDVSKFINLAADRTRIPSATSIHDLIILEYRVSNYRHEVRDFKLQKENLINEVKELRAEYHNLLNQVYTKKLELEVVKKELETEKFFNEISKDIPTEGQVTP